jgi:hypothetical protein
MTQGAPAKGLPVHPWSWPMSIRFHPSNSPSSAMGPAATPEPGRRAIRFLLLASLAVAMPPGRAADISVEFGPSWSGKSGLGSTHAGFVQAASDRAFTVLGERFQLSPDATAGVVLGRDDPIDRREVWLLGMGVRVRRVGHGSSHWFWESQAFLGARDTPSLSGHLQFGNGFGYAHHAWELKVRHLSNGGLDRPNHGETMLLVGYRF